MSTAISPCNQLTNTVAIFQPTNKKEWAALGLSCAALLFSSGAAVAAGVGYLGYKWATVEDPNTVQRIYTPPRPTKTDLLNLRDHAHKIAALWNHATDVMGIAFVPNQEGRLTPIYIQSKMADLFTMHFTAHDLATNKPLGFAIAHIFSRETGYLKEGYWALGRPKQYGGYGSSQKEVSKMWLEQVTNQSNYKNIGVILIQAIQEAFPDECKGRIILDAVRGTHPYYYKMGFRAADPEKNRLYARYARNHQKPARGCDLGMVLMHLPESARQLWLKEIAAHPIRFPFEDRILSDTRLPPHFSDEEAREHIDNYVKTLSLAER